MPNRPLTPYDRGTVLEPKPWIQADWRDQPTTDETRYGRVDFDNDEAGTELVVRVEVDPETGARTVRIETINDATPLTILLDGAELRPAPDTAPAKALEPQQALTGGVKVSWEIDLDHTDATTPIEAARLVWDQFFNRGEPDPEDACCFTVTDEAGTVGIDLAEHPRS